MLVLYHELLLLSTVDQLLWDCIVQDAIAVLP